MDEASGTWQPNSWSERLPWLILVRAFRLSIQLRMLVPATLAVLLTAGGWYLLALGAKTVSSDESVVQPSDTRLTIPRGETPQDRPRQLGPRDEVPATDLLTRTAWRRPLDLIGDNPVFASWEVLSRPLRRIFALDIGIARFVFLLLCGIWSVVVWSMAGAALTRMAAVQFTQDERLSLRAALAFGWQKYGAYFWAPFYPMIGAAIVSLPVIALGWLLRFDGGILIASLLWPVALMCSLIMAVILLGLLVGWPLMWATISTEGTDTFDAMSRSYAYTYQRPLNYLFYALVSAGLGALGWLVVSLFASSVIHFSFWSASWSGGHEATMGVLQDMPPGAASVLTPHRPDAGAVLRSESGETLIVIEPRGEKTSRFTFGSGVSNLWQWVRMVRAVVLGFGFSFFWVSTTAVYLLLRRDVDATEMDEVYLDEEEDASPLPEIENDARGAPVINDSPTNSSVEQGDRNPGDAEPDNGDAEPQSGG